MANPKRYIDDNGILYYTEKLKTLLDELLAVKADKTQITEVQGLIAALQSNLQDEATNRSNADTALQANITAEETARIASDNTLQANITAEETARTAADTTLQGNITAEATARSNADTTLQGNIDQVASDLSTLSGNTYRKNEVYTKAQTDSEIATAIAGVTQIRFEIVSELPETGENGVIYLVQYAQTPEGNVYQEWIWLASSQSYETLGSTNQIDLSNYVTFDDISALTNNEIKVIFDTIFVGTWTVTLTVDESIAETTSIDVETSNVVIKGSNFTLPSTSDITTEEEVNNLCWALVSGSFDGETEAGTEFDFGGTGAVAANTTLKLQLKQE